MDTDVGGGWSAPHLRVLGPLQVVVDGEPVRLGGTRQRAVLARLIGDIDCFVSTDQLAAAVWRDSAPPGYVSTIQTYIFHLRTALEPGRTSGAPSSVIRTEPGGYRLSLNQLGSLDAVVFQSLVASGRARLAADDPAGAAVDLRAADDLWRGDVLADLVEFDFAREYADRLAQLRADAEECLLDAESALGHDGVVIDLTARLIAAYPLRERLHAQRMIALYRSGRQSEALAAYASLRRTLVDELGIEPNQQLRELHRQILDQDPGLGRTPRAGPTVDEPDPPPRGTSRRPHRRLVWLAATMALLAAGGLTAFAVHNASGSPAPTGAPNSAVAIRSDGRVGESVPVGGPPGGIAASGDTVWIADPQNSTITRIDAKSRRSIASIPVGGTPIALTVYQDDLWVADNAAGKIEQISRQTNTSVREIPVGHNPSALAGGFGFIWVANQGDGTVTRVDPSRQARCRARSLSAASRTASRSATTPCGSPTSSTTR